MGKPCMVTVVDVTEKSVTIDANHPLAGETITYTSRSRQYFPGWLVEHFTLP